MLGGTPYPFDRRPYASTGKTKALREGAEALKKRHPGATFGLPNLAIIVHARRRGSCAGLPDRPRQPPRGAAGELHALRRVRHRLQRRREELPRLQLPLGRRGGGRGHPRSLRGLPPAARRRRRLPRPLRAPRPGRGARGAHAARPPRRARRRRARHHLPPPPQQARARPRPPGSAPASAATATCSPSRAISRRTGATATSIRAAAPSSRATSGCRTRSTACRARATGSTSRTPAGRRG